MGPILPEKFGCSLSSNNEPKWVQCSHGSQKNPLPYFRRRSLRSGPCFPHGHKNWIFGPLIHKIYAIGQKGNLGPILPTTVLTAFTRVFGQRAAGQWITLTRSDRWREMDVNSLSIQLHVEVTETETWK